MCSQSDDPTQHDVVVTSWGEVWGAPWVHADGRIVVMRRKGQRVRFFDHKGEQIGPEHRNVVPALVWAWSDLSDLSDGTEPWLLAGIRREIAGAN